MNTLWDMNTLLSSYWGMYAVQTVLHSLTASVLVDCALFAWDMRTPSLKQRFRLIVVFLPLLLFPVYQLITPRRGDVYFRLESLLDGNKWFFLELGGGLTVFTIFAALLAFSALVFVIQELVPIVFSILEQMRASDEQGASEVEEALAQKVSTAMEGLPFPEEAVEIVKDGDLALFSDTGLTPRIYISTGLIKTFGLDHLQAAFAHEIGHIQRTRRPVLVLAYIARVLMFYNPVSLIEFRRIAQEEEKVCDDIAVTLIGKPRALAEAVHMLRPSPDDYNAVVSERERRGVAAAMKHYGHDALLRSRIRRLEQQVRDDDSRWRVPYIITVALIVCINYFVV
jgi:Zn-dependent protease with chaperone function